MLAVRTLQFLHRSSPIVPSSHPVYPPSAVRSGAQRAGRFSVAPRPGGSPSRGSPHHAIDPRAGRRTAAWTSVVERSAVGLPGKVVEKRQMDCLHFQSWRGQVDQFLVRPARCFFARHPEPGFLVSTGSFNLVPPSVESKSPVLQMTPLGPLGRK